MKFPTPISTNPPHWACHDDAQGIPVPSRPLSLLCSTHHSLSPKSAVPSTVSVTSETPLVDIATSSLSASSPAGLRLSTADTPRACEYGLCSLPLSVSARSRYRTPVPVCLDNASGYPQSAPHIGTSSPTLCGMSYWSQYVTLFCNLSCRKVSTFIQTKVTAINCGVLTTH